MARKPFMLLLVLIYTVIGRAAEPEWKGYGQNWCVVEGSNKICLPSQFEPVEFGFRHAFFSDKGKAGSDRIRIEYFAIYRTADFDIDALVPLDLYVLEDFKIVNGISISQYSIDANKAAIPAVDVFVLVLANRFVFHVTGGEKDELESLSLSLASQYPDLK